MASKEALDEQLKAIMKAMNKEGLTDEHFVEARSLKDVNGPTYFLELIPQFCSEVEFTLKDITTAVERNKVKFSNVRDYCMKIKGGVSCIGACRLAQACKNLILATESKSKEKCLEDLNVVKQEYYTLKDKLDIILQLEMEIVGKDADK